MSEQDNIKLAKGFGYKAQDVNQCIERLVAKKNDLKSQIDKLRDELKEKTEQNKKLEEQIETLKTDCQKLKDSEAKRVDDFGELMENGKKIVNQMLEDAKQESAETIYKAKTVLDDAKAEAEQIKSRSLNDVKNISALLAEIAKTSAKSKEHVVSLYDQIDSHYQSFIDEMQKNAQEIFPKESDGQQ